MNSKKDSYPKLYLYRRIVNAKIFIDTHYQENIDLVNIADEAFFSKFHFIRLFKKSYGKTPHQYLISVRIDKAGQLLRNGSSVTDTCFSVGFESLASFSGLFQKITGKRPTLYRSEQQRIKAKISAEPLGFIPHCFAEKKGWIKKSNFQEVIE
jgi:AraC-like DNA-binding protein